MNSREKKRRDKKSRQSFLKKMLCTNFEKDMEAVFIYQGVSPQT